MIASVAPRSSALRKLAALSTVAVEDPAIPAQALDWAGHGFRRCAASRAFVGMQGFRELRSPPRARGGDRRGVDGADAPRRWRPGSLLALLRGLMRAFPPVAVLLVRTAPARQPRAEPVARRARLQRFGIIAAAALALRIRSEPPLNERRLRVGRGSKAENEAGRGQRERNRHADPPRPPSALRLSADGDDRIVGHPHPTKNIRGASALQALRRLRIAVERRKKM